MTNLSRIRVVVIGGRRVGKSAVTVRYLTKRYIGEYCSTGDMLYRHSVTFDNVVSEVEILDTSRCTLNTFSRRYTYLIMEILRYLHDNTQAHRCGSCKSECLYEHIRWGEAFVVVYSVCDTRSFREAQDLLTLIARLKLPSYYTALLLGNQRDLDHIREVCVDAGQEVSLTFGCQFYEVSAAEHCAGVSLAFQSLVREARAGQLLRALPVRRKLGVNSVSKVIGNIFGITNKSVRKKRPSLSI